MTDLIEAVIECGRQPLGEATSLPFAAYSDPDLFALECERIFRRDWIPVCAEASLRNPGDYLALDLANDPVVVLRASDGELRALSNVCRHRGTPIAERGFGENLKLVCPYHAWKYDECGRLRGVPHAGSVDVDRDRHALPSFAVDVWGGIVFIHLGPDPKPLSERLAGLDASLADYDLDRFDSILTAGAEEVWDANWKAVLENGMESYHVFKVHPQSLEPELATRNHSYLAGGDGWCLTPGERTNEAPAAGYGGLTDFARRHYVVTAVPPCLYGGLLAEVWILVFVHPIGPEQTRVSMAVLVPSGREEDFFTSPFGIESAGTVGSEDREICERLQRGMKSRASGPGQLVELERILVDFHHYLAARLDPSRD